MLFFCFGVVDFLRPINKTVAWIFLGISGIYIDDVTPVFLPLPVLHPSSNEGIELHNLFPPGSRPGFCDLPQAQSLSFRMLHPPTRKGWIRIVRSIAALLFLGAWGSPGSLLSLLASYCALPARGGPGDSVGRLSSWCSGLALPPSSTVVRTVSFSHDVQDLRPILCQVDPWPRHPQWRPGLCFWNHMLHADVNRTGSGL